MKKTISFALTVVLAFTLITGGVSTVAETESAVTLIACSDFQNPNGNDAGKATVQNILSAMGQDGVTSADGFFCCGDYDYHLTYKEDDTAAGVNALRDAVKNVVTENLVLIQGNHDFEIATAGMAESGSQDPASGAYGVFVINEDDYMWNNNNESRIKQTAQSLVEYLNEKLDDGFNKPVFVLSHLPLHYSMRTRYDGDGRYAKYLFDVLNEAGQKGLNLFFLFGHDHSNGWDDYLGGSAVYLQKGDTIQIAQNSQTDFKNETLFFTYMNAGYTGYYENHNGADDALTMSVFQITGDQVTVTRYDADGKHNLKASGKTNSYKNETGYEPNTAVYPSPQEIALAALTDRSPIADVIPPIVPEGRCYRKLQSMSDLQSGGKYLMLHGDQLMLPAVVTKSNGSSERIGFDVTKTDGFNTLISYGDYAANEWEFTADGNGWKIGTNGKYAEFIPVLDKGIAAQLTDNGTVLTVKSKNSGLIFGSGDTYLNYNSRGLINGYNGESQAAVFTLYEYVPILLKAPELSLVSKTDSSINIEWSMANTDDTFKKAIKYSVYLSPEPITEENITALTPLASKYGMLSYQAASLTDGIAYYFAVTAENPEGETVTAIPSEPIVTDTLHTHSYGEWQSDGESHWKECACGEIAEKTAHTAGEWIVDKEPTETENGSRHKSCTVCGRVLGTETLVFTKENTDNKTTDNKTEDNDEITTVTTTDEGVVPKTGDLSVVQLWLLVFLISGAFVVIRFKQKTLKH